MSKKQLNSRLDSLFEQIEQNVPVLPGVKADFLPGWTWECDLDGIYQYCAPEVNECLGIPARRFLGKSLYAFGLHADSGSQLQKTIDQGFFPAEVDAVYRTDKGQWTPVRLTIYTRRGENGEIIGWRGFNQVLPELADAIPEPAPRPLPRGTGMLPPLPPTPPARRPGGGPVVHTGTLSLPNTPWSEAGRASLQSQQMVIQPTQAGQPAVIAMPFKYGETGAILEIMDDTHSRKWAENDRLLVQEVANQLGLALENAQLYTVVQQELSERVRAQQETVSRNRDLATLNKIGQQLSRLTSREEIFQLVQESLAQLVEHKNLTIAMLNPANQMMSFPVYKVNNQIHEMPDRLAANGIAEFVIKHRSPLLIVVDMEHELVERGIEINERLPMSLLGIPLVTGDRSAGAVLLLDYERENSFSPVQAELVSTLASQAATAIENATLFQEIRQALSAIENRERYQSNVAQAVGSLSEIGIKALPSVLESIGKASQADAVFFAQLREDEGGLFWQASSVWVEPGAPRGLDTAEIQHMAVARFPHLSADLREKGWVSGPTQEMPSPENGFFADQRIQSILLLAVPGKNTTPSFIALCEFSSPRRWLSEETNVLSVAADALSNTIVREDLLEQLQGSLDESENLYKASHRLALANDMQEMVSAITLGLRTASINRAITLLFEFDPSGKVETILVRANWYSGHGTPPPPIGTEYARAVYERLLLAPTPIFHDDIFDAPIDTPLRDVLAGQNVRSVAILPLWAGKRQIGALLLESEEKHHFTGREIRSFPPLVDQMATAVENTSLFLQTQKALSSTELLYKLSSSVAQASDAQDLITLVTQNVMPRRAERASIIYISYGPDGEQTELEVIGFHDIHGEYQRSGLRLPASAMPVLRTLGTEPLTASDVTRSTLDPITQKSLLSLGIFSGSIVPLRSAGRLIGVILVSAGQPAEFSADEVHLLQVTGTGISVALERQRLLREAQRRALELQTAAEIARDTTSTLSPDTLMERIVNLLYGRFGFYHVTIFLLDETGAYALVRESTGEAGKDMKARNHKLAVGSRSIIGNVTSSGKPLIVNDVAQSQIYFPNPLLPETRSEMALPLKLGDRVIGALDIQSTRINAFTADDLSVLQILSDQIAVALDNANSYEMSQKAVEEMKEVDRVKSQFLANMSHELRTPLNSIIGFSRVIIKGIDGPINEIQKQDITAIYSSGQHLLTLINDILDLSRIDAGKMELNITELNLPDLINSVMSTATGLVKDKPIKLIQEVPADLPPVRGDATRVRQVLLNLTSNAAKFTDQGIITVAAAPTRGPKGQREVMISVTDSGPGVAPEDQAKLFQRFSQVDDSPTRKTGGTGLGLSISRSLIEIQGGRIDLLWSEVGKGSTFYFTLPVAGPDPEPEPDPTSKEAQLSNNIILSIDDDAQVISLYQRYLKPQGYQVVPLTSPKQAVQRAKEIKPFAITLDVMMPEKDGWAVMRDLKNDPETHNIPIIVCSIMEEEDKGFALGAADYLVKPFLSEDLSNALNRLNMDGKIKNVLVIDDSPEDLRLVKKIIDESGKFQVTLAESGLKGWQSLQENRPDAVILDLFMPDLDGFTILEKLRSTPGLSDLPVIILTGMDLSAEQLSQLSTFGEQLLAKSMLRENELLNTLDAALKKLKSQI